MTTTMFPNWFAPYAQPLFEKHLLPLAGRPRLRALQVGAFTGDASVWLLENVLTAPDSELVDVDTWKGSPEPEHEAFDWPGVRDVYRSRTAKYPLHRHSVHEMTSAEFFEDPRDWFDFIYIDGDHSPFGVLNDAVAAYRCLEVGGLLAFDDYPWINPRTDDGPGVAVDAFAACYKGRLQLIQLGAQAWFRKLA